jgi:galactokinase
VSHESFAALFHRAPEISVEAPGRVNLIGEHTDYNGGYVLPTVIPQRTRIDLAARDDREVRVVSETLGDPTPSHYTLGREARTGTWIDYVQGVTWALAEAGYALRGFDARVSSDVPVGSGLSSSAALEVAVARAMRALCDLTIDPLQVARVAHRAETAFVGAPVGVMDPMACSLASAGTALFVDTRTLATETVPLPPGAELVVIDSGVAHDHVSGDYRTRRAECEEAARQLGVRELRDVGEDQLAAVSALPPPLDRRARHVVTENARVLRAVAAMKQGDLGGLGRLFDASHASMRDDFEVSVPEVDRLVQIARAEPGVYGARLTGGGFGGAIVVLAKQGHGAAVGRSVLAKYGRGHRGEARVLVPPP